MKPLARPQDPPDSTALSGLESLRLISIHHRTAPLSDLERLALPGPMRAHLDGELLRLGVDAVWLGTCNRSELYWNSQHPGDDAAVEEAFRTAAVSGDPIPSERFARERGTAAAAHLFRVAAGLESMVLGEAEILGQVRDALDGAEAAGTAGPFLSELFRAAHRFGGRARSETRIGSGALSVASAAVHLLTRLHGDLSALTVVVIGAGATGLKVARHLAAERVGRLVIVNRTRQRADDVAAELNAIGAPLEDLGHWLAQADAAVAAARVERPLVTPDLVRAAGPARTRPLLLIDLSLPHAIDPACGAGEEATLRDLSGLEQVVMHNRARREREIPRVLALLDQELDAFRRQARRSVVGPLVSELRRRADAIRIEELERAQRNGELDAHSVDHLTRRLVHRLLHVPSLALRRGPLAIDAAHAHYLRQLFGLGDENEDIS